MSGNVITSIASGTFVGLGSLTQLYRANCYYSLFMTLIAQVKLDRLMDTFPTTKAPFNMSAGTPLLQLYAACFAMLHVSLIVNLLVLTPTSIISLVRQLLWKWAIANLFHLIS